MRSDNRISRYCSLLAVLLFRENYARSDIDSGKAGPMHHPVGRSKRRSVPGIQGSLQRGA